MKTKIAFGKSLKKLRTAKEMTQEDFSIVSSRTYISLLERGQKSPTLEKIETLTKELQVHPLSLLCLTYLNAGGYKTIDALCERIKSDLRGI